MEHYPERTSLNTAAYSATNFYHPPRLLKRNEAAHYLGIPEAELRRLGIGRTVLGRYERYDKNAIDTALDRLSGIASTDSVSPDDAEAALARFTQSL